MRVGFTSENKSRDTSGYPKFRLENKGERKRFCLIEPSPVMRRVHAIRMPVVENGRVVMETRKGKRGDYEVPMTEFVGQHLCTGEESVFESGKQIDPENCTMCQWAKDKPDYFENPYRRFAQHVLEYKTQPGTAKVATPFQAELKVWLYTDTRFDLIVDMVEEHGNPRTFDIIAGPCESVSWQKYAIQAGGKCEWAADDERKKLVAEVWKNNQCEDVEGMIARKPNAAFIQADVDKVLDRWAEVGRGDSGDEVSAADIDDLNDLLGENTPAKTEEEDVDLTPSAPTVGVDDDLSSLLGEDETTSTETAEAAVEEPVAQPKKKGPEKKSEAADDSDVADFDSLLDGLV